MLNPTLASMSDIHAKICAHLEETSTEELERYTMNYSTFIKQHSRTDQDDRGKIRELYVMLVASEYMDNIDEIAQAVQILHQQSSTRQTESRCQCGGYMLSNSGHDVCDSCGNTVPRGDDTISAVPFGVVVESSRYPYRRAHHFIEWVNQIQGRESTHIAESDIELIKKQMKKERIKPKTMDQKRLRLILRVLRLQRLYEHSAYLLHVLDGVPPPRLSHELEQQFKAMFNRIQAPFERHVKIIAPQRKNFLSYSYVIAQFCKIVNRKDLLQYFTQLKSREKCIIQDRIWKAICTDPEVNWPFYPSV